MAVPAFGYRLTKSEWMRAALILVRRRPLTLLRFGFLGFIALAFLTCNIVLFIELLRSNTSFGSAVGSVLLLLLFESAMMAIHFRSFRKEVNNAMQPDWDTEVTLTVEPSGLLISKPGVNESRYFWTSIQRVIETEKFTLIYVTKRDCIAIPKRALPDGTSASLSAYSRQGSEAGNRC